MRGHRTLVFLDDFDEPEAWGYWCADCDAFVFGSATALYPSRLAKKHERETRPVVLEAA